MLKLTCLVLVLAVAIATEYTIYGTKGTDPYTTMTTATASATTYAYKVTFYHKRAAAIPQNNGDITVCCTTAVSDSSKSALKDKCFVFQSACADAGGCSTTALTLLGLYPATLSGSTLTMGSSVGAGTLTYAATGAYTGVWELTTAQTATMGLPDTMSPSYKLDITCTTDVKTSGQTAATTSVTAKPAGNSKSFSVGSGAFSTIASVGVFSVISAAFAFF